MGDVLVPAESPHVIFVPPTGTSLGTTAVENRLRNPRKGTCFSTSQLHSIRTIQKSQEKSSSWHFLTELNRFVR